jgi:DNA-binding transcriptional MerR regulator
MTAASLGSGSTLNIGAVLDQLKPDFPDVSISKIRYLESEGLVTPERTASGYRKFKASDVARLRYALAAQRDHYLPLKVIKEQLDAIDRGLEPATPSPTLPRALTVVGGPQPEEFAGVTGSVRMTRVELLADSGLSSAELRELEGFGLLGAGPGGYYDADAAMLARTVAELVGAGLEPRHLRQFRTAADREASLVGQLVAAQARQKDPDARERAESDAAQLAAVLMRLHALLVKGALRRELGR